MDKNNVVYGITVNNGPLEFRVQMDDKKGVSVFVTKDGKILEVDMTPDNLVVALVLELRRKGRLITDLEDRIIELEPSSTRQSPSHNS